MMLCTHVPRVSERGSSFDEAPHITLDEHLIMTPFNAPPRDVNDPHAVDNPVAWVGTLQDIALVTCGYF